MDKLIELNNLKANDFFKGDVKIIKKSKPGPVVFIVTNGMGAVEAVKKDSDFKEGNVVYIEGKVNVHKGRTQIELDVIKKSEFDFDTIILKRSKPTRTAFSIQSDRYEKMKPTMIDIATRVRMAILEGQPIMIRHHNDADGITSGLSLEWSCLSFMREMGVEPRYMLFRSPSRAPYYASSDVLRDLVLSKRFVEENSDIKPLIIVTDNGSTPEDALGLNILKTLDYEAIVIDHHNPVELDDKGTTSVDKYLIHHLNPYKFGLDSKTSAGMLCYEIGRFISDKFDEPRMPAVAGIADRCDIPETETYIKNTGLERKELAKIGIAIDYISYQLKHDSGKGVYEELYASQQFVELINAEVQAGFETQLQSALPYLRTQDINGVVFSTIDIEKYTMRFTFPAPGLVLSRIHEIVASENPEKPVLSMGYVEDMIIIRANKPVLPVQKVIEHLQQKFPAANVDGGGHEMAGALRFVSAHRETLLEEIKTLLKATTINSQTKAESL